MPGDFTHRVSLGKKQFFLLGRFVLNWRIRIFTSISCLAHLAGRGVPFTSFGGLTTWLRERLSVSQFGWGDLTDCVPPASNSRGTCPDSAHPTSQLRACSSPGCLLATHLVSHAVWDRTPSLEMLRLGTAPSLPCAFTAFAADCSNPHYQSRRTAQPVASMWYPGIL